MLMCLTFLAGLTGHSTSPKWTQMEERRDGLATKPVPNTELDTVMLSAPRTSSLLTVWYVNHSIVPKYFTNNPRQTLWDGTLPQPTLMQGPESMEHVVQRWTSGRRTQFQQLTPHTLALSPNRLAAAALTAALELDIRPSVMLTDVTSIPTAWATLLSTALQRKLTPLRSSL